MTVEGSEERGVGRVEEEDDETRAGEKVAAGMRAGSEAGSAVRTPYAGGGV